MADLKPIGSEKLTGQDKIKRIMEIARYNENNPSNINETSRSEFSISLVDGNNYQIVKERAGYIIKKTISESETDYIEPMKNRKYYSSYSQALKRLNLLTKEVNRLNENEEGTSLFGEQKKYTLKTPQPASAPAPAPEVPAAPPSVPSPELPPSPVGGGEDEVAPEGGEEGLGNDMAPEDLGGTDDDMGMGGETEEEKVTFKTIQKLTGKLTQKIRTLDNEEGMTSEDIKYVINMILSSLELKNLSEEDKEDIMSKFEESEESPEFGDEGLGGEETPDLGDEELGGDSTPDLGAEDMGAEATEGSLHGAIFDHIFKESKVDKVISKYFEMSKKEIIESKERKSQKENIELKKTMSNVVKLTETIEQELASKKFLEENKNSKLIGKTNKNNLVFESNKKQYKISPEGLVI